MTSSAVPCQIGKAGGVHGKPFLLCWVYVLASEVFLFLRYIQRCPHTMLLRSLGAEAVVKWLHLEVGAISLGESLNSLWIPSTCYLLIHKSCSEEDCCMKATCFLFFCFSTSNAFHLRVILENFQGPQLMGTSHSVRKVFSSPFQTDF